MMYVFKLSQLWEILRFVDRVKAVYQGDGIIGLTCKSASRDYKKEKNKSKLNKIIKENES